MSEIIDIFKTITQIPRCSKEHQAFIKYVQSFAQEYGYECHVDSVHNILCKKSESKAKLCIQNHYDIVCLSQGCVPEIIEENGYFRAKDSTLGADNGIGCAYMLRLMQLGYDCEFLFTSDEEIGLIGANGMEFELQAHNMLNIDSEQEGEICIGCAGGVDIFASTDAKKIVPNTKSLDLYEISLHNLPGGHSGVNIHQEIPNAIKLMAKSIKECGGKLLDINGGERINSVPANVKAIIASEFEPQASHANMSIEKVDATSEHMSIYDERVVDFLYSFSHGVRGFDTHLNVVLTSINLAKIQTGVDALQIELSARSMDNEQLQKIKDETVCMLESFGFKTHTSGKYPAWKPDVNDFTNKVLEIYKRHCEHATLQAIHAGLECALFKKKFPHIKVASIGPTILNPHSKSETVELKSIQNLYEIVLEIVQELA